MTAAMKRDRDEPSRHRSPSSVSLARVGRGERQVAGHGGQRHVGRGADHHRGHVQVVAGRGQLVAGAGRETAVPGVHRLQDGGQAAELVDQGGRGLLPHPRHPGQAVAGVAAQYREVGVGPAGDLVAVGHGLLVDDVQVVQAADGVDDPDLTFVVDQLEQVPVAGDHVHRLVGAHRQGGDDVVGLVARRPGHGQAGRGEYVVDDRDLRDQRVWGLLVVALRALAFSQPVGLVGRHRLDPERGPPVLVHAGHQAGRLTRPDQARDHVQQPAHGVDRRAVRRGDGVRHPVERAVVERGGIQQHERAHPAILPGPDRRRAGIMSP